MGNVTCNTNSYTKTQISLCCSTQVTSALFVCNSGGFEPDDLTTADGGADLAFITSLPCYTTKWYKYNTTGKITGADTTAFKNDVSVKVTLSYCYESVFCVNWCVPTPYTAGLYVSMEPIYVCSQNVKLLKSNDKKLTTLDLKFTNKNTWAVNTDYNSLAFKKIKYYFSYDIFESIGYLSDLKLNFNLLLLTPAATSPVSCNLFTTIISNILIKLNICEQKKYFKMIYIISNDLFNYIYRYFKIKENLSKEQVIAKLKTLYNKDNITELKNLIIKDFLNIQYIKKNEIYEFFNKYQSIILFIYLIIYVNNDKPIDQKFYYLFSKLILQYSKDSLIDNNIINKQFYKWYGNKNILKNNYNEIFVKYILFIIKNTEYSNYILVKYLPFLLPYEELLNNNISISISKLFKKQSFDNHLNYYIDNYQSGGSRNTFNKINNAGLKTQEKVLKIFDINNANPNKLTINNTNKKRDCGCKK